MQRSLAVFKACSLSCLAGGLLLLSGCGLTAAGILALEAPKGPVPTAHFAIAPAAAPQAPPEPWQEVALPIPDTSPVQVSGRALVSLALAGVANLKDGHVTGSPVWIFDAATGKQLAQTVTYYDGSFVVDVPIRSGQRAALVASELVSREAPEKRVRLMAPLMITAGKAEQQVVLTPGTTALVAFLASIADEQAGRPAPVDALVASEQAPRHASPELGGLIAVFEPESQARFSAIAEASPELRQAASLDGLASGIQRFVGRLTRSQVKSGGARP